MQAMGDRGREAQLIDLVPNISRDTLDRRLHCGENAFGFFDVLQAGLPEALLRSDGANLIDVLLHISGKQRAVSTHAAFQIDTGVIR